MEEIVRSRSSIVYFKTHVPFSVSTHLHSIQKRTASRTYISFTIASIITYLYILISMHENDSIFSLSRFDTSVSNYICHEKDYSQLVIEEGQISNSGADLDAAESIGRR